MPDGPALAEAEEILRCQVEIPDDQVFVERDDRNAEPAENVLGIWRLAGRLAGRRGWSRG
jgi:hypothetical protein